MPVPFKNFDPDWARAASQVRRDFEELENAPATGGSGFDATVDPSVTSSDSTTHTYPNLGAVAANEPTWGPNRMFNIRVIARPGTNIVEDHSFSLPGPVSFGVSVGLAGGAVSTPTSRWMGDSRQIWDLNGFTISGAYWITIHYLKVVNFSAGAVTTLFTGPAVLGLNSLFFALNSTSNARRYTNVTTSVLAALESGFIDCDLGSSTWAVGCTYGMVLAGATANFGNNGDVHWTAGFWAQSATTPSVAITGSNRVYIDAQAIVFDTTSEGGTGLVPISLTASGTTTLRLTGGNGKYQLTISAIAGDVEILGDAYASITSAGNTSGSGAQQRDINASVSSDEANAQGFWDITGPANVRGSAWGEQFGNQLIVRGDAVKADVMIEQNGGGPQHIKLIGATNCEITADLRSTQLSGNQAYTIDAASSRNLLVLGGTDKANFTVASTNLGARNRIITNVSDSLIPPGASSAFNMALSGVRTGIVNIPESASPTGAAGGSLAGTFPNPTFSGRDASVDAINKDLLPALLVPGEGIVQYPAVTSATPSGAAGGSLAGTYPNPTFAGRDASVDELNKDLLPTLLGPADGIRQYPTPAVVTPAAATDYGPAFLLMGG